MRDVARICLVVSCVLAVTLLGAALGAASAFHLVLLYLAWEEPEPRAGLARFAFASVGALYGFLVGGWAGSLLGTALAVMLNQRGARWRPTRENPAPAIAYGAAVVLVVLAFLFFLMLLSAG